MRLQVPYDPGLPDAECASRCCEAWGISEVVSDVLTACSAALRCRRQVPVNLLDCSRRRLCTSSLLLLRAS